MYPPIHQKPQEIFNFERLDKLWERYPRYHEKTTFATLDQLLEDHPSYQKEFTKDMREEYISKHYEDFLIHLSWDDLYYRYVTKELLEKADCAINPYVQTFMEQFTEIDSDHKACFLIPESYDSQFFVVREVCKRAEEVRTVRPIFPDEETIHYLAIFDKQDMEDVLLMYHLDTFGGYALYDYPLPWYQQHLREDGVVLRSPYLPDRIAKYLGNIPFYHDPTKTVHVRRNIEHMIECGYLTSELELFWNLTCVIMPFFQWWSQDLALYEEKDGYKTDWRGERIRIRTELTANGVIQPKWKHELSLFHAVRKRYPDTLYQYRAYWLGRQSLDLFIPSQRTAIEYQGIQHFQSVDFFGGEEALLQRQLLDQQKATACTTNGVRLIIWPYDLEPTEGNVKVMVEKWSEV